MSATAAKTQDNQANQGETFSRPQAALAWLGRRQGWWVLAFFVCATLLQTWPLINNLQNSLFELGDPADSTYRIATIANNLRDYPLDLSRLYQTNAFFPLQNGLALDELLTGNAILAAPLIWLTSDPVLAFNLLILTAYTLSGFAMWLLVRHLTGRGGAGLVAGLIYAYSPWHMGQYGHLGIVSQQWMIFALFFLIKFLEASNPTALPHLAAAPVPNRKSQIVNRKSLSFLFLFAFFFVLQALAAGYHAYLGTIVVGLYLVYYFGVQSGLARGLWRRIRLTLIRLYRRLRRRKAHPTNTSDDDASAPVANPAPTETPPNPRPNPSPVLPYLKQAGLSALAGVIMLAIILPFVLPFIEQQQRFAFKREVEQVRYWSAAPVSLLRTTQQSWIYRPIERGIFGGQTGPERMLYPGLTVLILAAIGVLTRPAFGTRYPFRRYLFGFLAAFGFILCLGPYLNLDEYGLKPTSLPLPYLWLYNNVPGFDSLRVPLRFGQLLMLGLAVCAGYGVARLQTLRISNLKMRRVTLNSTGPLLVAIICAGLVAADFYAPGYPAPLTSFGIGQNAPPLYQWLTNSPEAAALVPTTALMVELPLPTANPVNTRPDYLVYATFHKRPMLNGTANIVPTGYPLLLNELDTFPDARTLDVMEGLGVKYAIVHRGQLSSKARASLDKLLQNKNERLVQVKAWGDDMILQLKPSKRLDKPKALLKPGAQIMLGEDDRRKSLYLHSLAGLLGSGYNYVAPTSNIYSDYLGVKEAEPNRVYDYAFLYKNVAPAQYGYSVADKIWENETTILYRRSGSVESYFSFQLEPDNNNLYPVFSASNPARLLVRDDKVSRLQPGEAVPNLPTSPTLNKSLVLLLATPQEITFRVRYNQQEQKLNLQPGFYRYTVDIAAPSLIEIDSEAKDEAGAYLLQARLLNRPTAVYNSDKLDRLAGDRQVIGQSQTTLLPQTNIANTKFTYYSNGTTTVIATPSLQVDIYSQNAPTDPALRHFGEWLLPLPPPQPEKTQQVELNLDLSSQLATGVVNGTPANPNGIALSNADGMYIATVSVISSNQTLSDSRRYRINQFSFRLSHNKDGKPVISDFKPAPTNALLFLPLPEQ